jgi:hypothetical protein
MAGSYLATAKVDDQFNAWWKEYGGSQEAIPKALEKTRRMIGGPFPPGYVPPPWRKADGTPQGSTAEPSTSPLAGYEPYRRNAVAGLLKARSDLLPSDLVARLNQLPCYAGPAMQRAAEDKVIRDYYAKIGRWSSSERLNHVEVSSISPEDIERGNADLARLKGSLADLEWLTENPIGSGAFGLARVAGNDYDTAMAKARVVQGTFDAAAAVAVAVKGSGPLYRGPLVGGGSGGLPSFPAVNKPPGQFEFTQNAGGRTAVAEGWLSNQAAPHDSTVQAEVTQGLTGYHAGHLIPARFGGPATRNNLVPMPELVNTSYVKSVENAVARYQAQGPVYLKVTVEYNGTGPVPSTVRHEFFRRSPAGQLEKIPGGDVTTTVDVIPSKPMGGATDPYTGRRIAPKDFLDPQNARGLGPNGSH